MRRLTAKGVYIMEEIRKIPYNIEAEHSVLGGIFVKPDAISKVLEIIKSEDFYKNANKTTASAVVLSSRALIAYRAASTAAQVASGLSSGTIMVTWSPMLIRKYVTLASSMRNSRPWAST